MEVSRQLHAQDTLPPGKDPPPPKAYVTHKFNNMQHQSKKKIIKIFVLFYLSHGFYK
jgi:hypothetical protein